jgi:hypothetical protein
MRHAVMDIKHAFCLALLSAGPAFTQTPSDEETLKPTIAPASVAYVYIGTATEGIYLYDAASDGKLTLVSGSPFKTSGLAIGSNGKYFITLGTNWLHSYPVASDGAIEKQESEINTEEYDGSVCGAHGTSGAILDHSGDTVDVRQDSTRYAGSGDCAAYQYFNISKAGALTFDGVDIPTGYEDRLAFLYQLPTFTSNDAFAYAQIGDGGNPADIDPYAGSTPTGFKREITGALENLTFNATLPPAGPIGNYYTFILTGGKSNYLAMSLAQVQLPYGETGPVQLGSFTVDAKGNIATTSTWKDMPVPETVPQALSMSRSGMLLAVAPGLQVFHFNGAEPITKYTGILTSTPIDKIDWDNNNHLYALSESTNKLYVFTVTETSVTEAPGSPYKTRPQRSSDSARLTSKPNIELKIGVLSGSANSLALH